MVRKTLCAFAILLLVGCDQQASGTVAMSGKTCVDGVLYMVTPKGGITVKFNPDSTVVTCTK